jgi:transposase
MAVEWKKDRGSRANEKWLEIRRRHELLRPHLNEQARRSWAGAEALVWGRGGVTVVSEATGLSHSTVEAGKREVSQARHSGGRERVRRPGGGRKRLKEKSPEILAKLEALVDPSTRGDPQSPLRWTCKSLRKLAAELTAQGYPVSADVVGDLLRELKYSLQANRKTSEGSSHPDRNAQFEHIASQSQQFLEAGEPVISVDTKKKEKVGNFKNAGREYQPQGSPELVNLHDFGERDPQGRVVSGIPYGVYDPGKNNGWVSVGVDHDTASFAVETIRRWWKQMGSVTYPAARRLLITADAGGSNGHRVRAWKVELQKLADETSLDLSVCHYPPGTSQWNKIEHRMFSRITANWRGHPLTSHEVIVNLIANTTTTKGLRIQAQLDDGHYPTGVKVPDKEMEALALHPAQFHGEWNYMLRARPPAQGP